MMRKVDNVPMIIVLFSFKKKSLTWRLPTDPLDGQSSLRKELKGSDGKVSRAIHFSTGA